MKSLKIPLTIIFAFVFVACSSKPIYNPEPPQRLSLTRSIPDDKTELFTLLSEEIEPEYRFTLLTENGRRLEGQLSAQEALGVTHLRFHDETSFDAVELIVTNRGRELERRALMPKSSKIAIASCMADWMSEVGRAMWSAMLIDRPRRVFLIGDNVYADSNGRDWWSNASYEQVRERYLDSKRSMGLYRSLYVPPLQAVWDDHDYGRNDGGADHPFRDRAKALFQAHYPILNKSSAKGQGWSGLGVGSKTLVDGVQFLFVDGRFFRIEGETHWGKAQESWVLQNIEAHRGPSVLIQGDQFFGGYHKFESFEGRNPKSFHSFLARLKKIKRPVFLLSGDRHLTELMEISEDELGHNTYELTTSGMHARVFPSHWKERPNPRQMVGVAEEYNFAELEVHEANTNSLMIDLTSRGLARRILFERQLTIAIE